jgi:iron complex outermembrane receptor protein
LLPYVCSPRIAANYQSSDWGATVESVLYSAQNKVSTTNNEQGSSGYGLLNVSAYWQLTEPMQVSFALENALDKVYVDHLGGYNRVADNASHIAVGERLPSYGRNVSLRMDYSW